MLTFAYHHALVHDPVLANNHEHVHDIHLYHHEMCCKLPVKEKKNVRNYNLKEKLVIHRKLFSKKENILNTQHNFYIENSMKCEN